MANKITSLVWHKYGTLIVIKIKEPLERRNKSLLWICKYRYGNKAY